MPRLVPRRSRWRDDQVLVAVEEIPAHNSNMLRPAAYKGEVRRGSDQLVKSYPDLFAEAPAGAARHAGAARALRRSDRAVQSARRSHDVARSNLPPLRPARPRPPGLLPLDHPQRLTEQPMPAKPNVPHIQKSPRPPVPNQPPVTFVPAPKIQTIKPK